MSSESVAGRDLAASGGSISVNAPAHLAADRRAIRARQLNVSCAGAGRIRPQAFKALRGKIQSLLKTRPGLALAGAAIVGFMLGRAFSDRT
jgi:hypothetical protein